MKLRKNKDRKQIKIVHHVRNKVTPVVDKFKKPSLRERTEEAFSAVPKITNDTVAEHREEVLKGARKYKYPLQHSKYKIVIVSSTLLVLALVAFFVYAGINLYKLQSTSSLMYRVTQIVPFPVAKAGEKYVSYDDYLFKLRRYMHYYETQQKVDFTSESGKRQLELQKPKTLEGVINDAYVKQLAKKNGVKVSGGDVQDALDALRLKNHLGDGEQGLRDIASKFFGWSLNDLKREIRQELLAQKVVQKLDVEAQARARQALGEIKSGADFGAVAAKYSDDQATKGNSGQYTDTAITIASQEVPYQVTKVLQAMKPNDVSEVISTPTTLEIVKLIATENGKYKAAHIQITLKSIDAYINAERKAHLPHAYVHFKQQVQ